MSNQYFPHEKLDVYRKALEFVAWCGRLQSGGCMPRSTSTSLDKASTGVALNIAEGNGKFSIKDRCRFIGHARTAALQATATLDVLAVRHAKSTQDVTHGRARACSPMPSECSWHGKGV